MALQKERGIVGISTPLMYHRIVEIQNYRKHQSMRVQVQSFESEEIRFSDGQPFPKNLVIAVDLRVVPTKIDTYKKVVDGQEVELTREVPGDPIYIDDSFPVSSDPMAHAYHALKAHPDWSDAIDIFEEDDPNAPADQ